MPYAQAGLAHCQGAPYGLSAKLPWFHRDPAVFHTNRKRLNCVAHLVNILVPWLAFCFVFALMSFSTHYEQPVLCYTVVIIVFGVCVGLTGFLAYMTKLDGEKAQDHSKSGPMWYGFLCLTCFLAISLAFILGNVNFGSRMREFYNLQGLATYKNIDPAMYVGQQLVDAGRITFQDKVHVDVRMSMAFKDTTTYCVAPIVSPSTSSKTYLDFWAVGTNCCSGTSGDFHCEGANDSRFHGGLRLMNDADRPFYRLAVQQAEATYKVSTHKPLFFVWNEDPIKYSANLQRSSLNMYFMGLAAAFVVQCFLVLVATLYYAKVLPNR